MPIVDFALVKLDQLLPLSDPLLLLHVDLLFNPPSRISLQLLNERYVAQLAVSPLKSPLFAPLSQHSIHRLLMLADLFKPHRPALLSDLMELLLNETLL